MIHYVSLFLLLSRLLLLVRTYHSIYPCFFVTIYEFIHIYMKKVIEYCIKKLYYLSLNGFLQYFQASVLVLEFLPQISVYFHSYSVFLNMENTWNTTYSAGAFPKKNVFCWFSYQTSNPVGEGYPQWKIP